MNNEDWPTARGTVGGSSVPAAEMHLAEMRLAQGADREEEERPEIARVSYNMRREARVAGQERQADENQNRTKKNIPVLVFLVVGDII